MANLRTLLNERSAETDLDLSRGRITVFTPFRNTTTPYCWIAPSAGIAVVEVWGGGGGGAGGICCGAGIPGNSGAYSRAAINMSAGGFICGSIGAGGTASATCLGCRGACSTAGIAPAGTLNRCMRSQGGWGGQWACNLGSSHYNCFFTGVIAELQL